MGLLKINYYSYCIQLIIISPVVFGHGMLMDPVNRASAWRRGFNTPINYNDNENYCGGYNVQYTQNKGKCGVCGDDYSLKRPRPNEDGGIYGTKTIVKTYIEGQEFTANVTLTSNHRGYFEFSLCPLLLSNNNSINNLSSVVEETEECFKKYPILTVDGKDKYILPSSETGNYQIKLILPKNIICHHCSLRWHWKVANNWGICEDGTGGAVGCGPQETFRTCSDITILKL
ncbi:uncharacterized protein LOC130675621 [Microplitis mediator]|uniref:uncharacterized protein LOC130675621 n=1 Tax=Microplitis mediator TaxID=375433 RepID=UPI002555AA37|nr:uncharacterized protein LOC130675621 [Microplitis mediator]